MNTILIDHFINDAPIEIGVFDVDMNFIKCSNQWLKKMGKDIQEVKGKSYYDVFPKTSTKIKEIHSHCLKGSFSSFEGEKTILPSGKIQWLNWKINPWKTEEDKIGGLIIVSEDVTHKKNEEEYRLKAQAIAKIGGWEVNLITNNVYWTKITKAIHKVSEDFTPSLEEVINFYKKGYHRKKIITYISSAISSGTPWNAELKIVTNEGVEKWVRTIGKPEIVNDKIVRLTGTFQDIDDRKKAEIQHQETLKRLSIATKTANIGIWDFNIKKGVLSCDDSMYLLFELDRDNFSNVFEAWNSAIYEDDRKRVLNEMQESLIHEKEFNTEYRIKSSNGDIKYIKSIGDLHRDENGVPVKIVGAKWDVTEFKKAELELIKKKESFAGVFDNSAVGMALVGLDGSWLKINKSLSSSLGYTSKELMKLTFQDITHPDDLVVDLKLLQELIEGKRDGYQIEKRYFHKKGHIIYVILSVTKVSKIDGNISHFISQVVDITSRKKAENKVKSVLKITSEQNKSLTNFAHIVSHNLRSHSTNLSMLTGFLINEEDEKEKKQIVKMLSDSSESLNETITHLNEVVSVKLNVLGKLEKVNIVDVLNNVRKSIITQLNDNNVTLNVKIEKTHCVRVVPAYLDSILLNLLTNSVKYRAPDRKPIINITTRKVNNQIVLTFSDNGLGIDLDKHRDKVFGMYKTFHKHKDSKGIGLFITKNQIEAMNGRIDVESKVDKGTTFTLIFNMN